ncbi:MAG: hypothetical protein HY896_13940 [Deltaproteobacteria bacterium]|nr:hypothetical protein [Deltaproteobacteria bacterium]
MNMRKAVAMLAAAAFILGLGIPGISTAMSHEELKGTVTRIEGTRVTIQDNMGMEKTIQATGPEELKNIKIGDHVSFKNGMLKKEAEGAEKSSPAPGPKY